MLSKVYSAFPYGLEAKIIEVEVEIEPGLRAFHIIGLPDESIKEAAKRVSLALRHSGFRAPQQMNKRITVNLAPADLKKQGSFFDVAIAVGFLVASGQLLLLPPKALFIGELSLEGTARPVPGVLGIIRYALRKGFSPIFISFGNMPEASLISAKDFIQIRGIRSLGEIPSILEKEEKEHFPSRVIMAREVESEYDFADIKGQGYAKRGLEIGAAGKHHLFMIGPPGAGKSILAKSFPSLLPPLGEEEGLEVATILSFNEPLFSATNQTKSPEQGQIYTLSRPFRSPHHTASPQAVLGGGTPIKPGEITLAHQGVLFLDEFPEFRRDVLEGLRQPLEDKVIKIARSNDRIMFPANFQLLGASNPCPCGFKDDPREPCACSPGSLNRYQRKLSGPLMDRVDMFIFVPRLSKEEILQEGGGGEASLTARKRIEKVRAIQEKRFGKPKTNAEMNLREIKKFAQINESGKAFLGKAIDRFNLSMRAYHKVLKVSRTIADMEGAEDIKEKHIGEALQYRRMF